MNLEDYQALCAFRQIPNPVDKSVKELISFCVNNIKQYQETLATHEMKVFAAILKKIQDIDIDTKILAHSRMGYIGYALAFVGFEELKSDYLLREASEKFPNLKITTLEIRNNILTATLDKNSLYNVEDIKELYQSNRVRIFLDDIYIHPYFEKNDAVIKKSEEEKTHVSTMESLVPESSIPFPEGKTFDDDETIRD